MLKQALQTANMENLSPQEKDAFANIRLWVGQTEQPLQANAALIAASTMA